MEQKTTAVLGMEIRSVDERARNVVGVCVPYDETSYLTRESPEGERIRRGAFSKSIERRGTKIFLNREHDDVNATIGRSVRFDDGAEGLVGEFRIAELPEGDRALTELSAGLWPSMSVAYKALRSAKAADGVTEITEAYLGSVALTRNPAYAGADVLAVRSVDVDAVMAGFGKRPEIDLTPIPPFWLSPVIPSGE